MSRAPLQRDGDGGRFGRRWPMVFARLVAVLLAASLPAGPAWAQASPAPSLDQEYAFWASVRSSDKPLELQAYLDAFPNGHFRATAEARLRQLAASASSSVGPEVARPSAVPSSIPATPNGGARVRPGMPSVELVDGVVVELDAEALRSSSNLRLIVVPATTPDAISDAERLVEQSTPVRAERVRLTIPAGPPGQDEIRLYHIAPFTSSYAIAARAPVTVRPGVQGATLLIDLTREAERVGPARFEALHRDRSILIQAAFLALTPRTEWNVQWFGDKWVETPQQLVVIKLGIPNAAPDTSGSVGEAFCLLSAADRTVLDRLTRMRGGDPVLVSAVPTIWSNARASDAILLERCDLQR